LAKFRQKGEIQNSKNFRKVSDFEGFSNRHKVQQEKGSQKKKFNSKSCQISTLGVYTVSE
jgi:hypothetical protein